jgi:hypothetical protein
LRRELRRIRARDYFPPPERRAAAAYERAGEKLARRAERRFTAADNLAELPY